MKRHPRAVFLLDTLIQIALMAFTVFADDRLCLWAVVPGQLAA
jgi:hypothetical protein